MSPYIFTTNARICSRNRCCLVRHHLNSTKNHHSCLLSPESLRRLYTPFPTFSHPASPVSTGTGVPTTPVGGQEMAKDLWSGSISIARTFNTSVGIRTYQVTLYKFILTFYQSARSKTSQQRQGSGTVPTAPIVLAESTQIMVSSLPKNWLSSGVQRMIKKTLTKIIQLTKML